MAGPDDLLALLRAARQEQFLDVVDRETARARFHAHLDLAVLGFETVPLEEALGRVLAQDVEAPIDVPAFDRANVDGFAVRSADLAGAAETRPRRLRLNAEILTPGRLPGLEVAAGTASVIATGGMLPRGADAVVMIEQTDALIEDGNAFVDVRRVAVPGQHVAPTGSDIGRGEIVLRAGQTLSSREIGVLAAMGLAEAMVRRRPRVAILSTGDELIAPGDRLTPPHVFDSNAAILAAAVIEQGGVPWLLGIAPDEEAALASRIEAALEADIVILSGGTSKGAGDLAFRVVDRLGPPGILVHGVALKPGKPVCLAVLQGKPVLILPGFPTSAIVTFHEFAAPLIRTLAGRPEPVAESIEAQLPLPLTSERGRTEYVMVALTPTNTGLAAYPTAKGSGAVTAFSQADGFLTVPAGTEALAAGTAVTVRLLTQALRVPDLVVIGSHCVGLDYLLGRLVAEGLVVKALNVGSQGGLLAAERGECDLAGIHLLDPPSGLYNRPFLSDGLELVPGYKRLQGIVCRAGQAQFATGDALAGLIRAAGDPACLMINRNAGSGTRQLVDRLLDGRRPAGYRSQARSHNAVAAAVAQGRADWGVAIAPVAEAYGLSFLPLQAESYDFVLPKTRCCRPSVQRFLAVLADPASRTALSALGFDSPVDDRTTAA